METCTNCERTAMPPRGWSTWTCATCGETNET